LLELFTAGPDTQRGAAGDITSLAGYVWLPASGDAENGKCRRNHAHRDPAGNVVELKRTVSYR